MSYRKREFGLGGYYHIYNRGANKQWIFAHKENYRYLIGLMTDYLSEYEIGLVCYCMMPNHYHLLLHQMGEIPISKYINTVFNAYVQAFNRQEERSGTLFEGRFKHVLVDRQSYLLPLMSYIHLNPVVARLVKRPEDWEFSDYHLWISGREQKESISEDLRRVCLYRNELGIPSASEYAEMMKTYQGQKEGDECFRSYLLD